MSRKEIKLEELVEVLYQWHRGNNISQIKRSLGLDRKTIRKYLEMAQALGFSRDMELQESLYYLELAGKIQKELNTPLTCSKAHKITSRYQNTIDKLMAKKYMKPKQVYRILKSQHDYPLSYSSFNRYMHLKYPKTPKSCLRIEVGAGEEGQVDFGSAGMMYDPQSGKMRRSYAFVLTLSYSRLPYVEFVFDQGQFTWVKCHINAFNFFAGIPKRIILDNLKSGILQPNTYDPVFNRAYADCGKHYGFIIDPAKIARGDHKGKVERKIPVLRQQVLSTLESPVITDANQQVKQWCLHDYGMQVHGTIRRKPYEVFQSEEEERLLRLPSESFDIPLWKEAKVNRDHHVVFDKSYYSLPTRYIGKQVWVRGGLTKVQVFYEGELIKTHKRSTVPGSWVTDETDYPPEKVKYLMKSPSHYEEEALKHGEFVCQLVSRVMTEQAYRNVRKVQGLFRLAEKYGSEPLNLTCKRCLFYEDYRMETIKRVLDRQFYLLPLEEMESEKGAAESSFIRPVKYFTHN